MNTTRVSQKAAYTTIGALCSMALGYALANVGFVLANVGFVLVVILGLAAEVALFTAAAHFFVHRSAQFHAFKLRQKANIIAWFSAAAFANTIFQAFWVVTDELWYVWVFFISVLALVEYVIAKTIQWALKNPKEQHKEPHINWQVRLERRAAAQAQSNRPPEETKFLKGLDGADLGWLRLLRWTPVGNPSFGVKYTVQSPSKKSLQEASAGKTAGHAIGPAQAEDIAIAMIEILNIELESDWVSVQKEPGAGVYSITINTEDIFDRLNVYRDSAEPASIYDPCEVGLGTDGLPYTLLLAQHGNAVGRTESGKSSLINVILAYLTRCTDTAVWVCGTHKLVETLGPWIKPYQKTKIRPPFDWIAFGAQDTAEMLAAAMRVSDWRQSRHPDDPHRESWKAIVVLLDEASFALNIKKVFAKYQGEYKTPAELAASIIKATASANIYILLASQRGTNDNWGSDGGDINANMGYTAAFSSRDLQEIGRQMGDYQLSTPRHKGEYWLNPGNGDLPVRLKADYVREYNPAKKADSLLRKHELDPADFASEADISWARRDLDHALDAGSQRTAGAPYAERITDPDELMAYLADIMKVAAEEEEEIDGAKLADEMFNEIFSTAPAEPSADDWDHGAPMTTTASGGERGMTVEDAIVDIINSASCALETSAIYQHLQARGYDTKEKSMFNALTKLAHPDHARIARVSKGKYGQTHQQEKARL